MFRIRRQRRRGQALVEMAVLFPFFLLVVVGGIIDFGFAFYNLLTLQQIADDAAQWGADNPTNPGAAIPTLNTTGINTRISQTRPQWWTAANFQQSISPVTQMASPFGTHYTARVTLSYGSPAYTPFYQVMFGTITGQQSLQLSAQATYKFPRNLINRY